MTMRLRVLVRDSTRVIQSEIEAFGSLDVVERFNAPATWAIDGIPAASIAGVTLAAIETGSSGMTGLVVERSINGGPWIAIMSGRAERVVTTDSADGTTVEASGVGDLAWLRDMLAHPSPTDLNWNTQSHDERTGPAETILHGYVDANVGPSAHAARRLPGLTLGTNSGRGTSMTRRARAEALLDLLQQIAATDGLGFRIRQSGDDLIFETYMSNDVRSTVNFSAEMGNLSALALPHQASTVNYVYVGGSGEGTARIIAERGDPESIARYGRREVFIDQRQSNSATELGQTIANRLEEGKGGTGAELVVLDTDAVEFGADYDLGDLVSVQGSGRTVYGYVTEITIHLDDDGVQVTPTIAPAAVAPSPRGQASMTTAIRQLSANAEGYTMGMGMTWPRPIFEKPSGWQLADGTNGTTNRVGLFTKGAANDGELGDLGGSASVNLAHDHTGAPHTHDHLHSGPLHTHSHDHTGAPHTHNHSHTGAPHSHPHFHGGTFHAHNVDINHNHGSFTSAGVTPGTDVVSAEIYDPTDGVRFFVGDHVHAADQPPLGSTTIATAGEGSGNTGSDSTGATFGGTTGSDLTGASAANTGANAAGASAANTGSDASAATFSGNSGSALGSVTIDPEHVKIYWLERVA